MMKKFSASTEINAPAEKIWSILTTAENYPKWDPNMERLEGKIALGEMITAHTKLSSRTFPVKVSIFEPNKKMAWSSGMPLGLFKGERTFTLEPRDGGIVKVHVQEVFDGPMMVFIGRTIPDLQPAFETFVQGLKAEAERA